MIRYIEKVEIDILLALCQEHAAYEKVSYDIGGKKERLKKAIFDDFPKLYCLVALSNSKIVGYATYMVQFSTWDAASYIYLDCLYLKEAARGLGLGQQLMDKIYEEATRLNCRLIQWQTPDFNTKAIQFYKRIGAEAKAKERFFWNVQ